jgi:acyl-CoA hydrolase
MAEQDHDDGELALRVVMRPKDTNPYGTIFGGTLLSLLDQAAFIGAWRLAKHIFVTVAMDAIEFKKPVMVGDVLSFFTKVVAMGRTSIRQRVSVWADPLRGDRPYHKVTEGEIVLVAVDEERNPIPIQLTPRD